METNTRITRKSIDAFYDQIRPGAEVRCIANTFYRERGKEEALLARRFVVKKVGKSYVDLTEVGGPDNDIFTMTRPSRRVSDVTELSDTTITYKIRDPHTVTWAIESAS